MLGDQLPKASKLEHRKKSGLNASIGPTPDRDRLIRLWTELTGRRLSESERAAFLDAREVPKLRRLLTQCGSSWMSANGRRCLADAKRGGKELGLPQWLAECESGVAPVASLGRQEAPGSTERMRKRVKGLAALQHYGEDD
jgi:hypothetical protein